MGLPRPVQEYTDRTDVRRVQEAVARAMRELSTAVPFLDGALLDSDGSPASEGIAFQAGLARDIAHKLGRKPRGFVLVGNFGPDPGMLTMDQSATNTKTIRLTALLGCTVKVWVW